MALRLRGQVSGGREYCEACPCRWVLRLPWRQEKEEQGGPGVEGELRPWEGEAPDSLSTSTHPHQGLPAQTSQMASPLRAHCLVCLWTCDSCTASRDPCVSHHCMGSVECECVI